MKLREILSTHKGLALKLKQLEVEIERHEEEIQAIFDAIRRMMTPPEPKRRRMGFEVRRIE